MLICLKQPSLPAQRLSSKPFGHLGLGFLPRWCASATHTSPLNLEVCYVSKSIIYFDYTCVICYHMPHPLWCEWTQLPVSKSQDSRSLSGHLKIHIIIITGNLWELQRTKHRRVSFFFWHIRPQFTRYTGITLMGNICLQKLLPLRIQSMIKTIMYY